MCEKIEIATREMLSQVGLDIRLKMTEEVVTASYGYHFLYGRELLLNPIAIMRGSLARNVSWQDYLNVVISHEMGHIVDPEYVELIEEYQYEDPTEKRKAEIMFILESHAWEKGIRFVKSHNVDLYNQMNEVYVNKFAVES